jgi:hypothetical protein
VQAANTDNAAGQWGSGILVDPWHVLTCRHVVEIADPGSAPLTSRGHRCQPAVALSVAVGDHGDIPAEIEACHPSVDLALLRLSRAVLGTWAPLERRELPIELRNSWICGFEYRGADRHFAVEARRIDLSIGRRSDGTQQNVPYDFGAKEGFSGGPVFAEDSDGQPVYLGIANVGGEGMPTGLLVAAEIVRTFLESHDVVGGGFEPTSALARWCRLEGLAPCLRCGQPERVPDHVCIPSPDQPGARYHAIRPIAAAVAATHRASHPSAERLAAHVTDPAAIDSLLDELKAASGLPLRLPSFSEFQNLCAVTADLAETTAVQPRPVLGRPTTLGDYLDAGQDLSCPPATSAEWVEDRGRRFLCLHRDGETRRFDDATVLARDVLQVRAVVRTVVTLDRSPA